MLLGSDGVWEGHNGKKPGGEGAPGAAGLPDAPLPRLGALGVAAAEQDQEQTERRAASC